MAVAEPSVSSLTTFELQRRQLPNVSHRAARLRSQVRLTDRRQACAQLYRLHVGPQVFTVLLGRDESVCTYHTQPVGLDSATTSDIY